MQDTSRYSISDVTCIRGSGKKKDRDFGYPPRASLERIIIITREARAKTKREERRKRDEKERERASRQGRGKMMRRRKVLYANTLRGREMVQGSIQMHILCARHRIYLALSLSLLLSVSSLFFLHLASSSSLSFAVSTPNTNARLSPTILS